LFSYVAYTAFNIQHSDFLTLPAYNCITNSFLTVVTNIENSVAFCMHLISIVCVYMKGFFTSSDSPFVRCGKFRGMLKYVSFEAPQPALFQVK